MKGALAASTLAIALVTPMVSAQEFIAAEPLHESPQGLAFGLPRLVTPIAQAQGNIPAIRPKARPAHLSAQTDVAEAAANAEPPAVAEPAVTESAVTEAAAPEPQLEPPVLAVAEESAPLRPKPRPEAVDQAPEAVTPPEPLELALPQPLVQPVVAPEPAKVAKPLGPPLKALPTASYRAELFLPEKLRLQRIFAESKEAAKIAAALDLAQLYLAHMLLPEARDFHRKAQSLGVQNHAELYEKWRVQSVMLDVLQQKPIEESIPEGWPEAALWVLAGRGQPDQFGGELTLLAAVTALQDHSEPVISRLLPQLFDVAIAMGDLRIADGLLRGAKEATSLHGQPVFDLMQGRLTEAYGLRQEAFDHYAKAAQGRDLAAQLARIAMTDLALSRKDPKLLPDLRDILLEGVNQWRHGREGLVLRARLAQVAEDLGDIPLALDIMGRIRQDHPGTPEAVLAHERGALALAAFAVAMEAGEISLETYLTSMRQIEAFYRLDPVWPIARSTLGRALSQAGLHEAAAAEFGALRMDLARLGAPTPIDRIRRAISLSEAEEYLVNHEISLAREALAIEGRPPQPELAERYHLAALRAALPAALADMPEDPVALLEYARFARRTGELGRAHEAHRRLSQKRALLGDLAEAMEASLLAHQRGAKSFAAKGYFELRDSEKGSTSGLTQPIFEALAAPMPSLMPLSRAKSEELLARSQAALEATAKLIAMPLPIAPAQKANFNPIERPKE